MDLIADPATAGIGLGIGGGLIRSFLGTFKRYRENRELEVDPILVCFNGLAGGITGGIVYSTGLVSEPFGVLTAGYAGMDLLEGLMKGDKNFRKTKTGKRLLP